MSAKALLTRLYRAVGRRRRPEDCPGPTTALVERSPTGELRDGTGELYNPETAMRCRLCGHPHSAEVTEVVISNGELTDRSGERP